MLSTILNVTCHGLSYSTIKLRLFTDSLLINNYDIILTDSVIQTLCKMTS